MGCSGTLTNGYSADTAVLEGRELGMRKDRVIELRRASDGSFSELPDQLPVPIEPGQGGQLVPKRPKSRIRLDDKVVAAVEPPPAGAKSSSIIVYDGEVRGFGIRVTRKDFRSFVLSYRTKKGEERRLTIGEAKVGGRGVWTTAAARNRARELLKEIDQGKDPQGELNQHRAASTVNDLADRYIDEWAKPKKRPGSLAEDVGLMKQWVRPELGNKKIPDVSAAQVRALHAKITAAGTPIRANRVVALLSKMFSLAEQWELRPRGDNPARGSVTRNREEARVRFLTADELQRITKALAEHPNQEAAAVVRLLLLTGARRGEVLRARWTDFDLKAGTWTKPASATKQKKLHHVPLSPSALELLKKLRAEADAGAKKAAALERDAAKERHPKRKAIKENAAARLRVSGNLALYLSRLRRRWHSADEQHKKVLGRFVATSQAR